MARPIRTDSLQGFIDLLFEEPHVLVVVDYKTHTVPEAWVQDALDRYRLQGGTDAPASGKLPASPSNTLCFSTSSHSAKCC